MIDVILLERIDGLGPMGQTVKVRPGYARNFLLPQNKALRATKANQELFDKQRAELEARNAAERATAEKQSTKLEGLKLVVIRQASEMGQLFGSVSARDVADAAQAAGHKIDRIQVQIDSPIKTLGLFPVKVKLHPEVTLKVIVNVARSAEEAMVQAEKGAAVARADAERAEVEAAFGAPAIEAGFEAAAKEETGEEAGPAKKAKKVKKADAEESDAETDETPKVKKPRAKKTAE